MSLEILGGLAALASAASWAFGGILWRRIGDEISPFAMNLSKGVVGLLYLTAALWTLGISHFSARDFLFLGLSGLLGIACGDTFFFIALMNLGPRLSELLGAVAPVFTALAAFLILHERPSPASWVGIFLIVGGVAWVLNERLPANDIVRDKALGIRYGLLSVACMTAGVILAKLALVSVQPMEATLVRMSWGVAGLVAWGSLKHGLKEVRPLFKSPALLGKVCFAVFVGLFGGFWMFLVALKYASATTAATLNSTSPLFILPMAAYFQKEKISRRAVIGAFIAVGGIICILY